MRATLTLFGLACVTASGLVPPPQSRHRVSRLGLPPQLLQIPPAKASVLDSPLSSGSSNGSGSGRRHMDALTGSPTWVQAFSLIVLMLQTSGLSVFMRMSRIRKTPAAPMYASSTAVVLVELVKLLASTLIHLIVDKGDLARPWRDLVSGKHWRLAIPSALYVVQNNLQYISANYLPAQVYQVLVQLKVVTTALVSEKVLGRRHSRGQWAAITALFLGLALVQVSLQGPTGGPALSAAYRYLGLGAVLASCLTSAAAGVYSEKLVKASPESLWSLNMQMSVQGVLLALAACALGGGLPGILRDGFFLGYTPVVWATVLLQALGGLLISFVVKSTNSVVKGFATSGSVVLSCLLSHLFLRDFAYSASFVAGAVVVCSSAIAFALASPKRAAREQAQALSVPGPLLAEPLVAAASGPGPGLGL